MTSTYDASDVADSFEDLSSLSSDKDIQSLVLATTYSDDDDDDLSKNSKATDNNKPEANGTKKKEEDGVHPAKVNDVDDDGFVYLAGADVEDEEDILSEGWESSRSTPPELQCAHQNLFTKPEPSLPKNQASILLHQNNDTNNSNDKEDPIATTTAKATTNNSNPTSASSIPRSKMRMTKDILAALSNPIPSASVAIASSPSPDRVLATPSRLRLVRQNAANTTATTPDATSVPSPQAKQNAKRKKAVLTKLLVASTVDQPTAPTATVGPSVSSATAAATVTTEKTQQQEDGDGICKAIRRSTGKRCIRHGEHDGYCSMHRLLVK